MKPQSKILPSVLIVLLCVTTQAAQFKLANQTMTVPDGFEVMLAADTNRIQRPVSASFDDHGRLYVTDSSGSNDKPADQLKNPLARILCLQDTDGDGRFDKSVVFAEHVMFPQGCLWHDGWVYVAAPPSIWRFKDTNGDGVADVREEWWKGNTLTGCANDVHGPYLGPDGYIYWTKGAFAEQTHKLGNGRTLKDKAAHIFRARPDGSDLDVIMSGGMDNPVEVAFTPEGETIFTSTFIDFSKPGYRDGIAHAVYGGVFGKIHDVIEDGRVKRAGPDVMHPFYQAGPAAECGIGRYQSDVFGPDYRNNFFATTFNLHKVTRHILKPSGATYASTDSDFLVSDNVDFHPTDVLEDADGSLLVVDTGGWYKLCCPSSQLAKPDILGAIYRVRKAGAVKSTDKARIAAYKRMVNSPGLDLKNPSTALQLSVLTAPKRNRSKFVKALSNYGSAPGDSNAHAVRAAVEGLGRLRDKKSVPAILETLGRASKDLVLEQALIRALIDIESAGPTRAGLKTENPAIQRGALIALDQMDGSDLKPDEVVPFVSASDERLRAAANWILGRHPNWGGELAGWFRQRLTASGLATIELTALDGQLHILTHAEAGKQLLADAITQSGFRDETRVASLNAIAGAGSKETPASWKAAVLSVLETKNSSAVASAVRAARTMNSDAKIIAALRTLGHDSNQTSALRLDAIAALPAGATFDAVEFDFLRSSVSADNAPITRSTVAGVLAQAKLDASQLAALTDNLKSAGPLELNKLCGAFDGGGDDTLGSALLAALRESKSAKALHPSQLKPHFAKFPEATQKSANEFLASLDVDSTKQAANLEALLAEIMSLHGDIRRGQLVFTSSKTACVTCHEIGYVGGKLGPSLSGIGKIRTERDLLEAVVYPSASFVRSYEPMTVVNKSGDDFSGVLRKDALDEVVLATGAETEMRIARADIADMRPGKLSVMPQGLDTQLSKQELADLVVFLKSMK
ncbi:MAG: c-type cytochrome [Verrucomicrobia bacterium]|nr:c-type cytochrome [Verrucomicrobiota bacterium]